MKSMTLKITGPSGTLTDLDFLADSLRSGDDIEAAVREEIMATAHYYCQSGWEKTPVCSTPDMDLTYQNSMVANTFRDISYMEVSLPVGELVDLKVRIEWHGFMATELLTA